MSTFDPAPAGDSGNLCNCVTMKEMTALEVATTIRDLRDKLCPSCKKLGIGIWEGDLTGKLSGVTHGGEHVAVFNTKCLVAPFGPRGDAESEALAAIFVLAIHNADKIVAALKEVTP